MLGSLISGIAGLAGGLFNAKKQEDFAKNSLTWKAADAERAGISKIFAMGAPTHSFAPVSTGDWGNLGNSLDKQMAGQGGMGSTTTNKVSGINSEIQRAQLDGLRIDNDIKRAELASKINIATQPGAGGVLDRDVTPGPSGATTKRELVPGSPGQPQKGYGVIPEIDMYRSPTGFVPAPPQNLSEVHENNAWMRWQWMARNQVLPFFYDQAKTPPGPAPEGAYWQFNPLVGEYQLKQKGNLWRDYENYWRYRNRQEVTR